MKPTTLLLSMLAGLSIALSAHNAAACASDDPKDADKKTIAQAVEESAKLADKFAGSFVVVQYHLQYDKGESPGYDFFAGDPYSDEPSRGGQMNWEQFIREERPFEITGYVIGEKQVLTADTRLHPRFIKGVTVKFGDQTVDATIAGTGKKHDAVMLTLSGALKGVTPLTFDAKKPGPYAAITHNSRNGTWGTNIGSVSPRVRRDAGRTIVTGTSNEAVIVAKDGTPVGLTVDGRLAADDSWKGSPASWPMFSAQEMKATLATLEKSAEESVLRCTVNFRSPRSGSEGGMGRRYMPYGGDSDAVASEWHGNAIVLSDKSALILGNFKPKATGRLESVKLFDASGASVKGTFAGTLKDYGAFLVTLDKPIGKPAKLSAAPATSLLDQLLLKAEINVVGESRIGYYLHDRVASLHEGWRNQLYPDIESNKGGNAKVFIFTADGALACVPLERREKVAVRDEYGYGRSWGSWSALPAVYLSTAVNAGSAAFDPENRPLTEDEEARVAWLGVEMQSMNIDLARANKVVEETNNGQSGGIVNYIYPGSPAAKAGLKEGDIVLRLHVKDQPKPLEVQGDETMAGGLTDQHWQYLARVPGDQIDRFPKPWGSVENPMTRALTDIGFGTPFIADVHRDGKTIQVAFAVEQSPAHYDSAKKYKSEEAGLTVRELTYEVRRYFQVKPDEPGVIISRVEQGGKASVAGLVSWEQITHVNDVPVNNVDDFQKAIAAGGELRISAKRMTEGRIVKLKLAEKKSDDKKADEKKTDDKKPEGESKPAMP